MYFNDKMNRINKIFTNINKIFVNNWLFILVSILFISGILSFFFFNTPYLKDFLNYMTGFATILLAILTSIYVITTNGQLNVMRKQLKEMEFSRNLQTQPLPIIKDVGCYIEPPKIFIDVPNNRKIVNSTRVYMNGKIENIGVGSAVSIDIIPNLICKYPNEKCIEDVSERFDFLEESGTYELKVRFNTKDEFLVNFIESPIESLPIIDLTIYYKNVLGAFFKAVYKYRIYSFDEDMDIIKKWLKNIKMFDIDFSDRIRHYNSLVKINPEGDDAQKIYDEIKSEFEKNMQDSKLEVALYLIPGAFNVKPISDEEFNSEIGKKSFWYGTFLGPVDKEKWLEIKKKKSSVPPSCTQADASHLPVRSS